MDILLNDYTAKLLKLQSESALPDIFAVNLKLWTHIVDIYGVITTPDSGNQ